MSDDIEIIRMPKLGLNMLEGKINEWHIKEGDTVEEGDDIGQVGTEKINHDIACSIDGVVKKLLVEVDDVLAVEKPLAIIANEDLSDTDFASLLEKLKLD